MTYFLRGEAGLIGRFRDGDKGVLQGVYRAYADTVTRVAERAFRWYAGSQSGWKRRGGDVADVVQEVFVRAFEPATRRRFNADRLYAPYLSQITRHVVIDYLRRLSRQMSLETAALTVGCLFRPNACDELANDRTMLLVQQHLDGLPIDVRRVYEALYVECLSQRNAATALGVGRQVVRSLESRLQNGLRTALEEAI